MRPEKKRKGSKKPVKKKSLKTFRRDAGASSPNSYSSWSCSTCRSRSSSSWGSESDSGRSRSPLARAKRRAKLREGSRSKSPLARADRKAKLRGRSRSRSPRDRTDRRVKSKERSRSQDRDAGTRRRSSQRTNFERDGGRYRSRSTKSSSSRGSRSYSGSGHQSYGEGKGKEVDQPRRLQSALVVIKEPEGMEERLDSRDKIVRAYDDVARNVDAYEQASKDGHAEFGWGTHATDTRTKLHGEPAKNSDVGNDDSSRLKCGDAVNAGNSEAEDLELLLRQKALENFRKFRGGLSANTSTSADQKDESVHIESCKDAGRLVEAKNAIISSKCQCNDSLACQGSIQRGSSMTQPRIRSIVNIPTENDDGNSVIICQNASETSRRDVNGIITSAADGQTTPNHLRTIEGPKDIQNKKAGAKSGSSTTIGAELKVDAGSASGPSACLNVESGK